MSLFYCIECNEWLDEESSSPEIDPRCDLDVVCGKCFIEVDTSEYLEYERFTS